MPRTITLTWKPGTSDYVHFTHEGQRHTVRLRLIHRLNPHSLDALYLRGKVTLPVTWEHRRTLMAQTYIARRAVNGWENEGGALA
ncbi:hypothetical protein [Deinococcus sp.]|uniref:hypothetical protein n=1 Tax=Deinococcus sp. TaxID=47478 RepID=UPI002869C17B|nr:hypothetical protein [Deinococcus sp.]